MPYSMKEIIDIAIGIEETGYDFYVRCQEKFKDPAIRDTFDFLAREELEHGKLFRTLNPQDAVPGNFTEEYFAYLRAIGGSRVFGTKDGTPERIVAAIHLPIDAIRHAMIAEKESILFYSEMKGLYPADRGATVLLDRIIAEERKHVVILADLAQKIRMM